jgi:hypothetical protein
LGHTALKALEIASENSIYFVLGELPVVFWAQGKPIALINGQLALLRVQNMANTDSPEPRWAPIRFVPDALMVLDHFDRISADVHFLNA